MSYFQHDTDATNDPKITALISEFGGLAYGIFWRIVELLHNEESHKLQKKNYIYSALAKQMSTSVEQIKDIIKYSIECEIFYEDEEFIWSKRVFKNIEKRNNISVKRSEAGKISALKRTNAEQVSTNAEQVSTNAEQVSTLEIKEKEIKEKEILKKKEKVKKEIPPPRNIPSFQELKNIYIKTAREIFIEKKITINEVNLNDSAEEFCEYWVGDEVYPGAWYKDKKYKDVKINPERTAKNNIIKFKIDYLANYDIPYQEPKKEIKPTPEQIERQEKSRAEIKEMMERLKEKYKNDSEPQKIISDKKSIDSFAENFGRV